MSGQRGGIRTPDLLAGVLSLLLPGLGQVCTGRVRRGLVWLAAGGLVAAAAALSAAVAGVSASGVLAWMLEPGMLLWLLAGNAGLALLRVAAVADAAHPVAVRSAGRKKRALAAGVLSVLVALTVAPHALVGLYGWQAHRILSNVFIEPDTTGTPGEVAGVGPPSSPALPDEAAATSPPPTASRATPPAATEGAAGPGDATPTPPSSTAPDAPAGRSTSGPRGAPSAGTGQPGDAAGGPADVPPPTGGRPSWVHGDRLTVALLGSDAGPGRSGARTDAMLVLSVHLVRGEVAVFGVPRNLTSFPVAERAAAVQDSYCPSQGGWRQLSALYTCLDRYREVAAEQYPDTPDPAARGVADTLSELTGIPVDHYMVADFSGFVRAVDALGGVTVDVVEPLRTRVSPAEEGDNWIDVDIPAGEQRLDGRQALGFVRSRTGADDYDRMRRQRCLLSSLAASADPGRLLRAFPSLADVLVDHVVTDIPADRLPDLIRLRGLADLDELVAVGLVPPRFQRAGSAANLDRIEAVVRQALDDPQSLRQERTSAEGLQDVCG